MERKYALRAVRQRLHQASFREAVIMAYNGRCALSGLPEPLLLDAAHIVPDGNERLGQPVVEAPSRGLRCPSDRHRPGLSAACIRAAARASRWPDAQSPDAIEWCTIHLPNRVKDHPDRERLAVRFERFKEAA